MKNQKGITLIALVITIIVLLILAGITIALITSNDSAPDKAAQSKIMNDVGGVKDAIALNATKLVTDYYTQKYVATSNNASTTAVDNSTILTYFDSMTTTTTGLFDGIDAKKFTVKDLTVSNGTGTFYITSVQTVSKGGTAYHYSQKGTINANGGITWSDTLNTAENSDLGTAWRTSNP